MVGTLYTVLLKIDHENSNCRWCDPRDACSLPQRGRPDVRQFLTDFVRQAGDLPVTKMLRQEHSFELFQACYLLELASDVALVLQVDLNLLDDCKWQGGFLTHKTHYLSIRQLWSLQQ